MVTDGKNSGAVTIRENRQDENGIGSSSLLSMSWIKNGIDLQTFSDNSLLNVLVDGTELGLAILTTTM